MHTITLTVTCEDADEVRLYARLSALKDDIEYDVEEGENLSDPANVTVYLTSEED